MAVAGTALQHLLQMVFKFDAQKNIEDGVEAAVGKGEHPADVVGVVLPCHGATVMSSILS